MVKQLYAGRRRDGARRGSGTRSLSATSLNALYGHPLRRGKKFDVKHAFYCGQDRPNAVLYTSNPVSNFAVVTARGTPGIMRLWDNLAGVGAS